MTIPFTPGGGNNLPSINPLQGTIAGAGFSALAGRTQENVTAALQAQLGGDDTWSLLWDQFWQFIRAPFDWVIGILKNMFPGLPWDEIDDLDLGEVAQWVWDQVEEVLSFADFDLLLQALRDNPEEFLGSLGNVAVDGANTFSTFLNELWMALTGQSLIPGQKKNVLDVADAAGRVYDDASAALGLGKEIIKSGSNLIKNPGFENLFFQQFGSMYTALEKRSGVFSLMLVGSGAFTASYSLLSDNDATPNSIEVSPGDIYYAEVYVKGKSTNEQTSGGVGAIRMLFQPYNQSNQPLNDAVIGQTASTALNSGWTKLSGYVTMPANAKYLVIKLQLTPQVAANETYYFDDVTIREVTVADKALSLGSDAAFSGTNIVNNASFEDVRNFFGAATYFSTEEKRSGSRSLKIPANGGDHDYFLTNSSDNQVARIPASPSDRFYYEFWVLGRPQRGGTPGNAGGGTVTLLLTAYNSAGTALGNATYAFSPTAGNNGLWTKHSGTLKISSNSTVASVSARIRVGSNVPLTDEYYFDDFIIREITAGGNAQDAAQAADDKAQDADDKAQGADDKAQGATDLALEVISSSANLIKNPGFENIFFQQAGSMFVLTPKRSGLFSLQLTGSASGAKYTLLSDDNNSRSLSVGPFDTLYAEVWVRGESGNQTSGGTNGIRMAFEPLDGAGAVIAAGVTVEAGSTLSTSPSFALNSGWQLLSGYVTMPAGTSRVRITLELTNAITAGRKYYFDDVVVREVTVARRGEIAAGNAQLTATGASGAASLAQTAASGADGKAVAAQTAANTAKGLANTALQAGPNLATNPGFDNTALWIAAIPNQAEYSTQQKRSGTHSLKMTGSAYRYVFSNETADVNVPCMAGDRYLFEVWVRAKSDNPSAGDGAASAHMQFWDNAGNLLDTRYVPMALYAASLESAKSQWIKMFGIVTAPDNAATFNVTLINSGLPSGFVLYWDDLSVFRVTESVNTNQALYSSNTPNLTINSAAVPGLEGSKITSGLVAEGRVENLTSTKITANNAQAAATSVTDAFMTALGASVNLCQNPSYEDTQAVLGWQPSQLSLNTNIKRTGSRSLRVRANSPEDVYFFLGSTRFGEILYPAGPGRKYYMEGWVYADAGNQNATSSTHPVIYFGMWFYDANSSYRENVTYHLTDATAVKGQWVKISGIIITPNNANIVYARPLGVIPGWTGLGTNNYYYVDDIVLKDITEAYDADQRVISTNQALYSSNNANPTINTGAVPGLSGSKIVDGLVAEARVENLISTKNTANTAQAMTNTVLKTGANLVANSSFEDTNFFGSGWYTTEQARTGSRSLKFTSAGSAGEVSFHLFVSNNDNLALKGEGGETYYVEFWMRGDNQISTGEFGIYFACRNSAGNVFDFRNIFVALDSSVRNTWVKRSGYITLPAGTTSFNALGSMRPNTPAGHVIYMDDVVIREETFSIETNKALYNQNTPQSTILANAVPAIDGSKINTGTLAEDRIASLSQSKITGLTSDITTTKNLARGIVSGGANLVSNPGFELTSFRDFPQLTTEAKRSGSRSCKLVADGVNYKYAHPFQDDLNVLDITVVPGDIYYLEAYCYRAGTNPTTGGVAFLSSAIDAAGNGFWGGGTDLIPATSISTNINSWTKVSGYITIPANATRWRPYFTVEWNSTSGTIFYVDDFLIKQVTASYLLGNSAVTTDKLANLAVTGEKTSGLDGTKITGGTVAEARVENLTSTKNTVEGVATSSNMLISPNFENTAIARFGYDGTPLQYSNAAGYVHQGSYSITWQGTSGWNGISLAPTQINEFYSVREGDSIGVSARIKKYASNNNSAGTVYLFMRWFNTTTGASSDSWNGNLNIFSNSSLPSGWQDMVNFGTCPTGFNALQIMLISSPDTPSGNRYYVDSAAVYRMANATEISSSAVTTDKIANTAVNNTKLASDLDASKIQYGELAEVRVQNLPAIKTTANNTKTAVDQFSEIVSGLVVTPINNAVTSFSNWFNSLLGWQSNTQNFQITALTGGTATKQPVWVCRYPVGDVSYPEILNARLGVFGDTEGASAGTAHTHEIDPNNAEAYPSFYTTAQGRSAGGFIVITQSAAVYDTIGVVIRKDTGVALNNIYLELFRERQDGQLERIVSTDISASLPTSGGYIERSITPQVVQSGERWMVRVRNSSTVTGNVYIEAMESQNGSVFTGFSTDNTTVTTDKTLYSAAEVTSATSRTVRWALFAASSVAATDRSFSDDFNRTALGSLWSTASNTGSNQIALVSGKSQFGGTTNGDQHAIYLRPTATNAQRVEANITGTFINGTFGGIMMHCSRDGSQVVYLAVSGFGCKLYTGNWASLTERASSSTSGDGVWALYFQPSDSRYYVQKNGVQVFSWQDAGGSPIVNRGADYRHGGIRHRREGIGINSGAIDNWTLRDYST